jgi:phosphoribosyl-ATP pyrophosphohydrolase/phosphoribosyl-AMP cyclohydrolase
VSGTGATELEFLRALEAIIDERLRTRPDGSYVARLAAAGERRIAQKLGEEAVELALAAASGDRDEQLEEAADLLFHLLLLLRAKDVPLAEVVAKLESRHRAL